MQPTPDEQVALDFQQLTMDASQRFFQMMQERHLMGEEKYGPIKFMQVNTLEEAMEEVVDLANYAMYTFLKLWALDAQLKQVVSDIPDQLGPKSFMKGT